MTIFNYTVNYVDVAIVGVVILLAIIGYVRGILMSVVNFIRLSIGIFLCFFFSTNYTMTVYNGYVRGWALQTINDKIVTSGNIDEVLDNLSKFGSTLPDFIAKYMNFKQLSITSSDLAESILNTVFEPVLLVLTRAAVFLAVFILFFGATGIIIAIVRCASKRKEKREGKKSKLKKTDKAFGAVFGVLKAVIIVFAFSSVVIYLFNLDNDKLAASSFLQEASKSTLLHYINEINPFNAITEGLI